ncbi:hypothetical protein J6590_008032 [Homalodisca vitripennis]|nr:hypothetical protein J6590_008032 [Homalodisca vitripennis]
MKPLMSLKNMVPLDRGSAVSVRRFSLSPAPGINSYSRNRVAAAARSELERSELRNFATSVSTRVSSHRVLAQPSKQHAAPHTGSRVCNSANVCNLRYEGVARNS